jgi:hypothetical protein
MPVWRLQVSTALDNLFPVDRIVITPHFDDHGVTTDPQGLCVDMANAWKAFMIPAMSTGEINVKAYDAQGTPPVYPAGDYTMQQGSAPASTSNREIALCLSFYSQLNRPGRRGRLYVPAVLAGVSVSGGRPNQSGIDKVASLAQILADIGGADVDWSVYSRKTDTAFPVSDYWVDNAWDVQRRRGLRPTARTQGTVSE